ncbi:MAG TPA: 16S rRNA processing protein RimM, partial [Paludibacteraceae bacterium]|nr:16S rRNA processing protein RimM [Paludibacteraceae bacterium]
MITSNEIAPVGKVIKSHGFNGELAIACNADFNMEACDYFVFDIEGIFVPFFIAEYRFKDSTTTIVRFDGIINETA